MTWVDKSEEEIRDAILIIAREETGLTSFKEGGVLRGLIETFSKSVYSLYADVINFYGGQFTYLEASGTMLDLRGRELGITRLPARKTLGTLQVLAAKRLTVVMGTWFVSRAGLRFKTLEDKSLDVGKNDVEVEAEFSGSSYNIGADNGVSTTAVLDGVETISASSQWIDRSGRDEESDADYRLRIEAKWDSLGQDNTKGKYETIALGIDGVDDVKVIRTPRGSGSMDVIIASYAGSPTDDVRNEVIEALDKHYLIARDIRVKVAAKRSWDFILTYSGGADKGEVENTLEIWLQLRKIGEDVSMRALYQDVFDELDISRLEFQSPTQDIAVDDESKIDARVIDVNKEP